MEARSKYDNGVDRTRWTDSVVCGSILVLQDFQILGGGSVRLLDGTDDYSPAIVSTQRDLC